MTDEPRKVEPAWIGNLARVGAAAEGMVRRRTKGTFGAASAGRALKTWSCACGWSGPATDLKASAGGIACPACGAIRGLKAL